MPQRCPLRCVLLLAALAVTSFTFAQEHVAVFPGVGHNPGEEGSFWVTNLTIQSTGCGKHPLTSAGGPCWSQATVELFGKTGEFSKRLLEEELFERGDPAPLTEHEDIIGTLGWETSGCLVITNSVPFESVVRSRNIGHPSGEFGFTQLPAEPMIDGQRYRWPISGDRGNCFTFVREFEFSALYVKHEDGTSESFWVEPGCRLFTGFGYGDTLWVHSGGSVYLGCSEMIDSTSDGSAVTLIPEFVQE